MRIKTTRLILRSFRPDDAQDLFAYLSDPSIYQFEPGEPVDEALAGKIAADMATSPDFWAVEHTASRSLIGQFYFKHIDPLHLMTWELGYIINPRFQYHGYGSEAAAALVGYGFRALSAHRVVAHCNPENVASWKLLEKIGFRREGLLRRNIFFRRTPAGEPLWTDTFVYARLAGEVQV